MSFEYTFPAPLVEGRFIRRLNRFVAEVLVEGRSTLAHVPNTGRMAELLVKGREVRLLPRSGTARKTGYDLLLVRHAEGWVCTDASAANRAVEHLLRTLSRSAPIKLPNRDAAVWQAFGGITEVRREVSVAGHRLDFQLRKGDATLWVEVKSVNLVHGGRALFPDAPTRRGTEHLRFLRQIAKDGGAAHVVFAVQRDDAALFAPNTREDPQFAQALLQAAEAGVGVHALSFTVSPTGMSLHRVLPVVLDPCASLADELPG